MAIFVIVTSVAKKTLKYVFYMYYLVQFHEKQVKALLNSSSKVNAISFDFTQKLCFNIQKSHIEAHKIDGSALKTFQIIIADFQF